jgi:3-carboxy-cis,cis-muconate cycloisomerase
VRPFSSPSEPPAGSEPPAAGLFDGTLARGEVRVRVADGAWLAALLEVEAALARAQARAGVIPAEAAAAVTTACRTLVVPIAELSAEAAASGNPVVPLVQRLRSTVDGTYSDDVHKGATSQDILDSAAMLVAARAVEPLLADLRGAADAAAGLARAHRDTPMAARTLLRRAVPTTFGLKAAGWMLALDTATERLARVRATGLAVQFGGAAGTRAGLNGEGAAVARNLAAELGLDCPVLPWHTDRSRIADLAGALGSAAGTCGKVARDLTLLAQDEVAEAREGAPGGSSAMAHKQNAVASVSALGAALAAPGLVATLHATMVQEHERAAGAWHAEWRPLRELLVAAGSAAAWIRDALAGLVVAPDVLRAHAEELAAMLGGLDVGEAVSMVDAALATRATRATREATAAKAAKEDP